MENENLDGLSLEQLAEMHYSTNQQVAEGDNVYGDGEQPEDPHTEETNPQLNEPSSEHSDEDPEDGNTNSQDWHEPEGEEEDKDEENPTSSKEHTNLENEIGLGEFKPLTFKANGKDWTIDNEEQAIRLMQMGLGSQKAVNEYKETRPYIKALRDNDLLEDTTLNLMIAAKNGDPKAYKALAQHFGISNEQLDELSYSDDEEDFVPENQIESANTLEFKERFRELEPTSSIRQLILDFDGASLNGLLADPVILDQFVLLEQNGMLNDVIAQVDKAYSLGYVNSSVPKLQTIATVITGMSQQLGYDILDPRAYAVSKKQQQKPKEVPDTQPKTKPSNNRVNSIQRRSASASPESYTTAPPKSKQSKSIADLLDEAEANGNYDEKRRLLEEHYGIILD